MQARQIIRNAVAAIAPLDARERDDIDDTLRWIDSGAELCRIAKPATPPRHLVSYILLVDGDHVLLVDHINAGLWLPPGGHVEPGEDPRDTARREVYEELGIAEAAVHESPLFLTVTTTVGLTAGHVDVSLWYVIKIDRTAPLTHDTSEFREARWFHRDAVPLAQSDPQLARCLRKLAGAADPDAGPRTDMLLDLHHVQLAMPRGREAEALAFYEGILGLTQIEKPAQLQGRGGVWFGLGPVQLHLGVEEPFHPARKAHPAFRVRSLAALQRRLRAAGVATRPDVDLPGIRRVFVDDPFGNRIELLELAG